MRILYPWLELESVLKIKDEIMKRIVFSVLFICGLLTSCTNEPQEKSIEKWKAEILKSERDFAAMAKEQGTSAAFLAFAAEDAVLKRNNALVIGKDAIHQRFENNAPDSGTLSWDPDFVDVSMAGDLGYTYGGYVYSSVDSSGQTVESKGVFHTVWKRQADGTWKFVWD